MPRSDTSNASPSELPLAPAGRFIRLGEVNRGGIGRIEAAHDPIIGREVAIKVLRPEFVTDSRACRDFADEAQITGQLEHPNIIPIYDFGSEGGEPFIAMKLIHGTSLLEKLAGSAGAKRGQDPLRELVVVLVRICDAVAFAHSRGVVHGDLKLNNVMVGDYGQVYLMDWGCATLLQRPGSDDPDQSGERPAQVRIKEASVLESQPVHGTLEYMAPEQLQGLPQEIDERTDVFALGGMLYEILTGAPPNDRKRLSGPGITRQPLEPPARSDLWAHLPPELGRIAVKALAPKPRDRYPTVAEFRADLEQFLDGGGWFETRVFSPGTNIVTEGEPGHAAYIIEAGECEVWKLVHGQPTLLRRLVPGDVFGETAVLTGGSRTATVKATTEVTLKVITADSLNHELDRNRWLAAFVRSVAKLFRDADERASNPPPQPR
jgi:serine/threonine-protein kinase